MADGDSSMTLTGTYSGLMMNMSGNSGTIAVAAAATARIGYMITTNETGEGKSYNLVTVDSEAGVSNPPSLVISVYYTQDITVGELDLDVKFTDIPNGTSMQIQCSAPGLSIAKQPISGSSLIGSSSMNQGPFKASIDINLWVINPNAIIKTSSLTMSMSKIESKGQGPVKKVLLEKIQINLSN